LANLYIQFLLIMNATDNIGALCNSAAENSCTKSGRVEINGRMCQVEASPYLDLYGEEVVTVKVTYTSVNSRQCVEVGSFGYNEGSIAANLQEVSTKIGRLDMDVIQHEMDGLCDRVRAEGTGEVKTELLINDRKCEVVAHREGSSGKNVKVEIFYTPLGSSERQPVRKFIHRKERPIAKHIAEISAEVAEIDRKSDKRSRVAAIVTPIVNFTYQTIPVSEVNSRMNEIGSALDDMRRFIWQNDLTRDEMLALRAVLTQLGGNTEMIQWPEGWCFSINECDGIPACRAVALQIEELQILLDARMNSQAGLERNVPPPIRALGSGYCNTVCLAHAGKNERGPIVLKPCDLAKQRKNGADFTRGAVLPQKFIGTVSGSYRRNLAASGLQHMLAEIGIPLGIEVPHVIANVSAAEANGEACIAMERLQGKTVAATVRKPQEAPRYLVYDNEFIRRETWLQLTDILTGQVDRHGNNVMYTPEGRSVGIDHDLSFPLERQRPHIAGAVPFHLVNPNERAGVDGIGNRNYGMPPFIDTQMQTVIRVLDLGKLESMYRECGLTRPEIEAAMSRARGLKFFAEEHAQQGRIIAPNYWASCSPHLSVYDSYAARHATGR
jgi:hypothetical protein